MSRIENALPVAIRKIPSLLCSPIRPYMVHCPYLSESSPNNNLSLCLFSSKKEKKKKDLLIIPQDLQKAFFFLSTVESVHLLFFCFFCLECFPIYSTWLVLFVITTSTQMSSPRRDYLIITLKGAQTLSHHLLFFSYKYKIHAFSCLATHNESWAS